MVYFLAFALMVAGPILLAWYFGDQILDFVSRRRSKLERRQRHRATSSLPVRDEVLRTLLDVEEKRNRIDDQVASALARYREMLRTRRIDLLPTRHPASGVEGMEQALLKRESRFNAFLDLAWMQSEALELVSQELRLLRDLAGLPATGTPERASPPSHAAKQLLDRLDRATRRRDSIDRRISRIGSGGQADPGGRTAAPEREA